MFGIGTFEMIIILVIALVVVGPNKLPGIVRGISKGIREFRRSLIEDDDKSAQSEEDNEK
jgi:Tat protein translocase TatB subunit